MEVDAQFWDKLAERYAAQPIADVSAYERKLEVTKARLGPEDVVLDIGCGTGSLALTLAPLVAHVHAVDVSAEMLRIGAEKAAAQGVKNVSFHQSTVQALPDFGETKFDAVCAYNILHLVPSRQGVLSQIGQLMKPGGTFISSTVCLGESWVPYPPILAVMRWLGKAPVVVTLSRDDVRREIEEAGFQELSQPEVGAKQQIAFLVATAPR